MITLFILIMENVTITDFIENEHSKSIYEMSLGDKFYPQDVFLNVYKYKRICPLMLGLIKHTGKSKEEKNKLLQNVMNFLNKTATENSVYGYVALNESKSVIGYLLYNVLNENSTYHELTFIFVKQEYRKKGIGSMLITHFITHITNKPAIVKVKIEAYKSEAFYKTFGFKSANETMNDNILLQNLLPSKKNEFSYMYYITVKYTQLCNLLSIAETKFPHIFK